MEPEPFRAEILVGADLKFDLEPEPIFWVGNETIYRSSLFFHQLRVKTIEQKHVWKSSNHLIYRYLYMYSIAEPVHF